MEQNPNVCFGYLHRDPHTKKNMVTQSRTNSSSLEPHQLDQIADWYKADEGKVSFNRYLTQCGTFGPIGSNTRIKARNRKKYLDRLRKKKPGREFAEILKNQRPSDSFEYEDEAEVEVEPEALRVRFQTPPKSNLLPPSSTRLQPVLPAVAPRDDTMDHLTAQVKKDVVLDFDNPEKNEEILPFKNSGVIYSGERLTVCNFILPLLDPRDLPTLSVTFLSDFSGFKVRMCKVSEAFIGEDEKITFLKEKQKRQSKKLLTLGDNCTKEEAQGLISCTVSSFLVFATAMEENTSTRFSERTFLFPNGEKARPNLLGNGNSNVITHFHCNQFSFGNKNRKTFAAAAEWLIPMNLKIEKVTLDKKQSKWDELDEATEGS